MRASDKQDSKSFGFSNEFDKQIYESKHDEIVVWLCKELTSLKTNTAQMILKAIKPPENARDLTIGLRELEMPIFSRNQGRGIMGFVDVATSISWKEPYVSEGKDELMRFSFELYFEVKTKVNLGDTVRQVNYYKYSASNLRDSRSKWIVVSPDDRYRQLLKDQGIGFIKYLP